MVHIKTNTKAENIISIYKDTDVWIEIISGTPSLVKEAYIMEHSNFVRIVTVEKYTASFAREEMVEIHVND